jgi:predicted nucleic acid-binding protein
MFIDSVVWIGAKLKNDQWHDQSEKIIRQFVKNSNQIAYINDYIILETVNFLLRKGGFDAASTTLRLFREHERIKIVPINDDLREQMYGIFSTYEGLSLTDASIIAAMQKCGINKLYSFDRGFDKVPDICRLE